MTARALVAIGAVAAVGIVALAPGVARAQTYVIKNARVVTVSGPTLAVGAVVIKDGRIADVGATVAEPPAAQIIDARGLTLYPGLIDASTTLGMEGVRDPTIGEVAPHLKAFWSFRSDSDLIEIVRRYGVTAVVARPGRGGAGGRLRRGLMPGQATVMSLSGDTIEKIEITREGPLVLNYPSVGPLEYSGDERFAIPAWSATKRTYDRDVSRLTRTLAGARAYLAAKAKLTAAELRAFTPDLAMEALIPVVEGKRTVFLQADSAVDIEAAVQFGKAERLDFILEGAADAWRVADFLKENAVRVILGPTQVTPSRDDDPVDIMYRTASMLHERGVKFALATIASPNLFHLPRQAGSAVAYGLPYDAALRAVTLSAAELLGLAADLGSIDKGKRAHLVLADGDILEAGTRIDRVFIDGRPVSLESVQTRGDEKYRRDRPPR